MSTRAMRTNAPYPVVLTSGKRWDTKKNMILAYYRDTHDNVDSVRELLWTTQLLRQAYDSPRIGGGIDPDVGHLGMGASLDGDREEEGSFTNYLMGQEYNETGVFDNYTNIEIQDMITHAETVALAWLRIYTEEGE